MNFGNLQKCFSLDIDVSYIIGDNNLDRFLTIIIKIRLNYDIITKSCKYKILVL